MVTNWFSRTGQAWRVVPLVVSLVALYAADRLTTDVLLWQPLLLLAGLTGFFGTLYSVTCPACGRRPVWTVARSHGLWEFLRLPSIQECPLCGDAGYRSQQER
jgi:predicted RNA-binding Zn-ribbon protein involved in translation (DUF1610 family)